MAVIAIDFGNHQTAIAHWQVTSQRPELLRLPQISQADALIPSLLYLKNAVTGKCWIGQQVIDQGFDSSHPRLFAQLKRRLSVDSDYPSLLDQQQVSAEALGRLFLSQIITQIQALQIPITELIFTVPIRCSSRYLEWLSTCTPPGIPYRLVDEPTAAALGYAISLERNLILAIDFGAGTLDLSLVRIKHLDLSRPEQIDQRIEVIAKVGTFVGGEDLDYWLMTDFCSQNNRTANNLLLKVMEKIKIQLSTQEFAQEIWFDPVSLEPVEIGYSRPQFEQILSRHRFYAQIEALLQELIDRAKARGMLKIDIQPIILIGGTCLIPSVQALIYQFFDSDRCHSSDPFGAVAKGALRLALNSPLQDALVHSYALRHWQSHPPQWCYQQIFAKGQIYPTRHPRQVLLRPSHPDQTAIEIVIGELNHKPPGSAEVVLQGDRLITLEVEHHRTDFIPLGQTFTVGLQPVSDPSRDRLKLTFMINSQRQMLLTVEDLISQETLLRDRVITTLV
ncbi:MAG: Hsp70 family protein [Pseudanabaenaceae cyanobacterium bins.68]|nr:Hsp70 family protein [Pseudanabaenaceae cyanobacterium bins.68]